MRREQLRNGSIPIFEPGLEALVGSNVKAGRLSFTTESRAAIRTAHTVFLAVGTPSRRGDGFAPSEARNITPLHELDQPQDVVLADVAAELPLDRFVRDLLLHWQIRFSCTLRTFIAGRDLGGPLRLRHDNCAA